MIFLMDLGGGEHSLGLTVLSLQFLHSASAECNMFRHSINGLLKRVLGTNHKPMYKLGNMCTKKHVKTLQHKIVQRIGHHKLKT